MPLSARRRTSSRMSRMPAGSRPVAGSSSSRSRGRRSRAAAARGGGAGGGRGGRGGGGGGGGGGGVPEPRAHPVRVAADLVLRAVAQLDGVEDLVDAARRAVAVERRAELQVAAAGQVRVE